MKKTEYFISQVGWSKSSEGLKQVMSKRDGFLKEAQIAKIIDEDIKVTDIANGQILFIIKLSYYSA